MTKDECLERARHLADGSGRPAFAVMVAGSWLPVKSKPIWYDQSITVWPAERPEIKTSPSQSGVRRQKGHHR